MREIANTRIRSGYRRVHVLLKREGWQIGRNQAYRLYCEEQLQLLEASQVTQMVVQRRQRITPHTAGEA